MGCAGHCCGWGQYAAGTESGDESKALVRGGHSESKTLRWIDRCEVCEHKIELCMLASSGALRLDAQLCETEQLRSITALYHVEHVLLGLSGYLLQNAMLELVIHLCPANHSFCAGMR